MTEGMVHVIDDDEAIRDSLTFLLDTAGFEARAYDGPAAFLEVAGDLSSGCVVTDVRMPQMSGLDLLRQLKEQGVPLPVIVITGHGDVPLAVEAMKAGAVDFLEKPFGDETFLAAVQAALSAQASLDRRDAERARFEQMLAGLSPREKDVLKGVVAGKLNKIIAFELGISHRTVEVYRAKVMTKTGAASLSELVRMALLADF